MRYFQEVSYDSCYSTPYKKYVGPDFHVREGTIIMHTFVYCQYGLKSIEKVLPPPPPLNGLDFEQYCEKGFILSFILSLFVSFLIVLFSLFTFLKDSYIVF